MVYAALVVYRTVSNKLDCNCCRIKVNNQMNHSNHFSSFTNESEYIFLYYYFPFPAFKLLLIDLIVIHRIDFHIHFLLFFGIALNEEGNESITMSWNIYIHGIKLLLMLNKHAKYSEWWANSQQPLIFTIKSSDRRRENHHRFLNILYDFFFILRHLISELNPCSRYTTLHIHNPCRFS